VLRPPRIAFARLRASSSRILGLLLLILLVLRWGPVPAALAPAATSSAGPILEPNAMHSMSDADMARWVEDWYAAHPARGQRSADVAADTFLVSNYHFDSDGDPSGTPVDTVRIDVGQTVMWKWVQGNHTTTNGTFGDPSLGLLWDQPMDAAHLEFSFRFDSTGVYNFICRPHAFQGMTGVVVVSGAGGVDVNPPQVTVYTPNGFDQLPAQQPTDISWLAIDDVGVTSVDLFYRDADGAPWVTLARDLPNSGHFTWNVPNVPTTQARVRVVARDAAGNVGADSSDDVFEIQRVAGGRVATTLRDFEQPGTQPLDGGTFFGSDACLTCHGGYKPDAEPGAWKGTMMSQAGRDPLFYACLAVAEQDAPSSGDLCIRCHSPVGWLSGHSQPTDGSALTQLDRDGVACQFCHRLVDPIPSSSNPPADQAILGALAPAHRPTGYANGQYVVDPTLQMRRGPYASTVAPHPFMESDFHRRGDLCGTCHDVSNPVFTHVTGATYAPGPLDQRADSIGVAWLMPIERTFSEWRASAYPGGVQAPQFTGGVGDGPVSACQSCHEPAVIGQGCNPDSFPSAPVRGDLPFHDMAGGNAWMPKALLALSGLYPGEIDPAAQARVAARATAMLRKAATLEVSVQAQGDSSVAVVKVTNQSGHKLPTGYPEGRRMWLEVRARDAQGTLVYRSGAYDGATGTLLPDPDQVVYEAHLGLSSRWSAQLGLPMGPTFHFVLNDSVYKDNRIPPRGFTQAAFGVFGGAPVDDSRPAPRYPDGQNWDISEFALPPGTRSVAVALRYQSTSREYVEFLRDENHTNGAGQQLYDVWAANGMSEPVVMAYDSVTFAPPPPSPSRTTLRAVTNPFHDALHLDLELARTAAVTLDVYDLLGRRVWSHAYGTLGPGPHTLTWDGTNQRGAHAGTGPFLIRVRAGDETLGQKVVRIR
jgi:plastocyanin